MGCRPSRRASACVRVAGEGTRGARMSRSDRPSDGEARLRVRNSKRYGFNPQDRYSAPPTDSHFPPHSCTTATYHHGCCATSRITLRLSKNGSMLEIEKCDFHDNSRICDCGAVNNTYPRGDADDISIPLRTRSAPNLDSLGNYKFLFASDTDYKPSRNLIHTAEITGASRKVFSDERIESCKDHTPATQLSLAVETHEFECQVSKAVSMTTADYQTHCAQQDIKRGPALSTVDTRVPKTDTRIPKVDIRERACTASADNSASSVKTNCVFLPDLIEVEESNCGLEDPEQLVIRDVSVGDTSCGWPQTAECPDVKTVPGSSGTAKFSWDRHSSKSVDTGCETDEDDGAVHLLSRLELGPTYVHGDFRNDFEDLFYDTSPELEPR